MYDMLLTSFVVIVYIVLIYIGIKPFLAILNDNDEENK